MSHQSELIANDINAYLDAQEHKQLLRFITCGSVDDGKSTLIGRLLYESHLIYDDQLASLKQDSKRIGTQNGAIDFALLVDGLAAEREQGITIDVAYRYFSTEKRKYIVADTPGHEQYTRNMATGASTADLALLMVDARKGILTQTKRHATIVHMLGVQHIVLVINKMDLMDYREDVYASIQKDFLEFAEKSGIPSFESVPLSALVGDNVIKVSSHMPWYTGKTLMGFLETMPVGDACESDTAFSMPVQWVNRPHLDFRGFCGQVTSGTVSVGDSVTVLPGNTSTTVESIVTMDKNLTRAVRGQSIALTLKDEVDASRGDVIVHSKSQFQIGHTFETKVLWMSEDSLVPGKSYWVKCRAKVLNASLSQPKYKIDVNTLAHCDADALALNEIGICQLNLDQDIPCDLYKNNHALGSFIIIDRLTNNTVGMGLIEQSLSTVGWVDQYVNQRNKYWKKGEIHAEDRSKYHGHQPCLVVLTGESQADYATIAKQCEKSLFDSKINVYRYGFRYMGSALQDMDATHDDIRQDMLKKLIEIGHAFCDAGLVFITSIPTISNREQAIIQAIMDPYPMLIFDINKNDSSQLMADILTIIQE